MSNGTKRRFDGHYQLNNYHQLFRKGIFIIRLITPCHMYMWEGYGSRRISVCVCYQLIVNSSFYMLESSGLNLFLIIMQHDSNPSGASSFFSMIEQFR